MIKAIIFDVDGVIFESEEIHYDVEAETLQKLGIPATKELTKEYSGVRLDHEFLDIAKRFNKKISLPQAIKIRDRILSERIGQGFPAVSHAEEVIKSLSKDYLLAVASSGEKRFVGKELEMVGLLKYFKAAIYGEDIDNPKPAPDAFLKAAKSLGVEPSECIAIEDSTSGFKAVKNAGMILIARKAEHNSHRDFSSADYVIEDLRGIKPIIQKLNFK